MAARKQKPRRRSARAEPLTAPSPTATISAGQSLSESVNSSGTLIAIIMPDDWAPANISFQISADNKDFHDLFDAFGNEITAACRAGTAMRVPDHVESATWVKIRSGTRDNPIVQDVDRQFTLIVP